MSLCLILSLQLGYSTIGEGVQGMELVSWIMGDNRSNRANLPDNNKVDIWTRLTISTDIFNNST